MSENMDLREQYNQDERFRAYVDRYAIPVQEALRHALVREVAAYYREEKAAAGKDYRDHIMERFMRVE